MRILLIAYEFPPSPSPQALRWAYLVRELARLGHEVHVLAPDIAGHGRGGLPEIPADVRVHRTFAGPMMGLVAARSKSRERRVVAEGCAPVKPAPPEKLNWKGHVWHAGLNWKGRVFDALKRLSAYFTFPDIRGEWEPWARRRLPDLLAEVSPDVVVSSHEPATTLVLGRIAKKQGYRWVADLGDPVLAPYTPSRWKLKSRLLERAVCHEADHVTVTAENARQLLANRHGVDPHRFTVLTQGFDDRLEDPGADYAAGLFDPAKLEVVYTGSFYTFRRATELLTAVMATEGVRLNVATVRPPDELRDMAQARPDKVRLLGFVPHLEIIRLQRCADLLVNLGNDCPSQVPGKLYEYLGAGRPILHVSTSPSDIAASLLSGLGRGIFCDNSADSIANALARAVSQKRGQGLESHYDLSREPVLAHGWSRIAGNLDGVLRAAAQAPSAATDKNSLQDNQLRAKP